MEKVKKKKMFFELCSLADPCNPWLSEQLSTPALSHTWRAGSRCRVFCSGGIGERLQCCSYHAGCTRTPLLPPCTVHKPYDPNRYPSWGPLRVPGQGVHRVSNPLLFQTPPTFTQQPYLVDVHGENYLYIKSR